jgi:hypothetical protein
MLLPALRALENHLGGRAHYVGQDIGVRLLRGELPRMRFTSIPWGRGPHGGYEFDVDAALEALRDTTLLLSLVPWESAQLRSLLHGAANGNSLGLTPGCRRVVDYRIGEHTVDRAIRLVATLFPGTRVGAARPRSSTLGARSARQRHSRSKRLLVVHNETLAHKQWPAARLRSTLSRVLKRHPDWAVVDVARSSRGLPTGACCALSAGRPRTRLSLTQAFATVAAADAFLGADSCMLHLADLHGVPGVGLFGPAEDAPLGATSMGFRFAPNRHLSGGGVMTHIPPAAVERALEWLLRRARHRPGRGPGLSFARLPSTSGVSDEHRHRAHDTSESDGTHGSDPESTRPPQCNEVISA